MFRHLHTTINYPKLIAWQAHQTRFGEAINRGYTLKSMKSQKGFHGKLKVKARSTLK